MSHSKRKKGLLKSLLFALPLIPTLFLSIILLAKPQTIQQQAQIPGCGKPGDPGNNVGVGKYCTKGGGQCAGTQSPYCSLDFRTGVPGICSRPCATNNDCGIGAVCSGSGLEKGCEPIACSMPPTNTPVPTKVPTQIPTKVPTLAPTATAIPQATSPAPTVPLSNPTSSLPPNTTGLTLRVFLHGIGNSGDNANPTANDLSNKNPLRKNRPVEIYVHSSTDVLLTTANGTLLYNQANGSFEGTIAMGTLSPGNYILKIKSTGYLRKQIPGVQFISASTKTVAPDVSLITGDTNGDNMLNSLDYNALLECFSDILSKACTDSMKELTDLNDDGKVNQFDYNLLLREISVQYGE